MSLYCACKLDHISNISLHNFVKENAAFTGELVPPDEYHITTTFSQADTTYQPFGKFPNGMKIDPGSYRWGTFGDNKDTLVLCVHHAIFRALWAKSKQAGSSWDWPAYHPHITVAKGFTGNVANLPVPDFALTAIEEYGEPLKSDEPDLTSLHIPQRINWEDVKRETARYIPYIEQAAADQKALKSYMTILALIVIYMEQAGQIPNTCVLKLPGLLTASSSFTSLYKTLKPATLNAIIAGMRAGKINQAITGKIIELGEELKTSIPKIEVNRTVFAEDLTLLLAFHRYLRLNSDSPRKIIGNKIGGVLTDRQVVGLFTDNVSSSPDEMDESKALTTKITSLVKKITGKSGDSIDYVAMKDYKVSHPDDTMQYSLAIKRSRDIFKAALQKYIRSSGKVSVDIEIVRKALDGIGVNTSFLPAKPNGKKDDQGNPFGFVGQIDEIGNLFTIKGVPIIGKPAVGTLVMNKNYDPNKDDQYVFKMITPVSTNRFYTKTNRRDSNEAKDDTIDDAIKTVTAARVRWIADLKRPRLDTKTLALMCEVIYQTQARIGANSLTGWKGKNITVLQNGIKIKYIGKAGVNQEHVIKALDPVSKLLVDYFVKRKEDYLPTAFVFSDLRGKAIRGDAVNKYLKSVGFSSTAHKLRHIKGTCLMETLIERHKFPKNSTTVSVDKVLTSFYEKIGKALGHRKASGDINATTSRGSYVSPALPKKVFDSMDLKYPTWLQRLLKVRDE